MIAVPPRNKISRTWWERGSAAIISAIARNDVFLLALAGLLVVTTLNSCIKYTPCTEWVYVVDKHGNVTQKEEWCSR